MIDAENWFTEVEEKNGAAMSLRLRRRLHAETSAYQRLEVYETDGFGNLLVLDGCIMLTSRDNFIYHEMMVHPALFSHPRPRRVLIIGGGDCGCLREVLRHDSVEHAEQVDIDERVTRLSEQFFPELCESNSDPRAHLHFEDGVRRVEEAAAGSYDVIIIDSTDPVGQAARLFSAPFYRACYQALGDEGVLVAQSESPLYHQQLMASMVGNLNAAGFAAAAPLLFPQCTYPSGWWSATLARRAGAAREFREADAQTIRGTRYYNADIHRAAFATPQFLRAGG
ncbi:MAG: polyamine aminopropyltransferase [Gammaproteobacteria bacterium]|jgi:spermidine synthase|nr:polyamine aminopropyltransferase [Gammaproteobacteria bacterium]